ncbi:DUF333 domain-containing protein, partial [Candidatus Woesearchaeota archaeon]|nr:DUF333 domain-containing protein [Candidatus Woesearchaeota archaeon]
MSKGYFALSHLVVLIVLATFVPAMPNPAARFCVGQGNEYLKQLDSDGNEKGYCMTEKGMEDAWDYFDENKDGVLGDSLKPIVPAAQAGLPVDGSGMGIGPRQELKKELDETLLGFKSLAVGKTAAASYDLRGAYPLSFDWRSYGGDNWITPVKDQMDCGSCWAFAAVGVAEAKINLNLDDSGYGIDLSEQDLVSCSSAGDCAGGYEKEALEYMRDSGIVRESCFPYVASDSDCNNKCANWSDELVKIDFTYVPADSAALKDTIANHGPITAYMIVCSDFSAYTNGIYTASWEAPCGWHVVDIVGYDDTSQCWICKNSWGTGWGESGFFRIAYSESVYDFDAWYNDPDDYSVFFLDDSYLVTATDIDNDGTWDISDGCPEDSNKSLPGQCGCGVADTDTDSDGTADCVDNCSTDPNKTEPG